MNAVPQQPEKKHIFDWPWAIIVSVIGLMWLGIAYSLGDAYYGAYLQVFSVDDSGFQIDRAKHLVLAVWGALNASIALQDWMGSVWKELLLFTAAVVVYIGLVFGAGKVILMLMPRITAKTGPAVQIVRDWPTLRKCVGTIIAVLLIALGFVWFCIFLPPFISIPSGIGAAIGEHVAKQRKSDFDKGCLQSHAKCYVAMREGKEIGRGYEIAQSSTRVALYHQGRTIQLPLDGVRLETVDPSSK
ncbi:hypothetical protein L0Z31_21075 (plasmid) [Burkholderia vietnamiensis]|uniref:hypothetical protein n=1 Tax=Burkholderia vietnamiensis TaxID=60552 RepID=UPI0020197F01|nr:hypothetical protein [Burkholderia vietnamiensis]MCO1349957.1 hypothetical protein [Burkholderia vietnamiensis]MCO1432427.1 hypothetical protein [Burkholderia vietnamiensis]UQN47411.1 hypothetical protein L0Y95_03840 [Burkholderia vietnamiensis]